MECEHRFKLSPAEFEEAMVDYLRKRGIEANETSLYVVNRYVDALGTYVGGTINGHAKCWEIELGWVDECARAEGGETDEN